MIKDKEQVEAAGGTCRGQVWYGRNVLGSHALESGGQQQQQQPQQEEQPPQLSQEDIDKLTKECNDKCVDDCMTSTFLESTCWHGYSENGGGTC